MALGQLDRRDAPESPRPKWSALALAIVTAVVVFALLVGAAVAAVLLSRSSLRRSPSALAVVALGPLAGHVERLVAFGPDGREIPLSDHNGTVTPRVRLAPGELVTIDAVIHRPGAIAWALGSTVHKQLTLRTPLARVSDPWLTLAGPRLLTVGFSAAVADVAVGHRPRRPLHARTLTLHPSAAAGSVAIAVAARSWERLGQPTLVTWFPQSSMTVLVARPERAPPITPTATLRLTFSRPLGVVLHGELPRVSPDVAGSWSEPNSHTLVFSPAGAGFPLAGTVQLTLPTTVADAALRRTNSLTWAVAPASELRLQQLLAQLGYLPLDWTPSGTPVAQTARAQALAAVEPPAGSFSWRYPNTPSSLQSLWTPGQAGVITKGAVMEFEQDHGLATDGVAGPEVWHKLLAAAVSGPRRTTPYSYVVVHESSPETLTLYSGGHVVLTSLANTGIPGRSTRLGTFTVFEHIRVGTMSGTNPDGSHYHDPGIPWISYFNGGDAIHGFLRASYGFRQSLGCVELPYADAARAWPYTPIGTLVTVTS